MQVTELPHILVTRLKGKERRRKMAAMPICGRLIQLVIILRNMHGDSSSMYKQMPFRRTRDNLFP